VLPRAVSAYVYVWHLLVLPLVLVGWLCAALGSGARWVVRRVGGGAALKGALEPAPSGDGMSRRGFLQAAAGATPALFAVGATGVGMAQMEGFRIRELEVRLPGLPEALEGATIAHVSDVHVGRFTRGAVLERIVEETNRLEADLVLFTGDLINYSMADLPPGLELLKALRARSGVFAVEGNHDLFVDPAGFRRETSRVVPLLVNEAAAVRVRGCELDLLGMGWASDGMRGAGGTHGGGRMGMEAAVGRLMEQRRAGAYPILMAHHPHAFDHAGDVPLTLAGHTHGGQLMLSEGLGCGPVMFRYWSGLYRSGGRALVVSNGVGNWFPVRTAAPAEIARLTLRRAVRQG